VQRLAVKALTGARPSKATNAPSAFDAGPQVTDAIADWINKGFAYGPVSLNEVPKNAKFSGIMTRPKPNGSVRIILNLSSPIGTCVNEGIDKDDFLQPCPQRQIGSELFTKPVGELDFVK